MNHYPAPEITAVKWFPRLLQKFARWRHFRVWEYGTCCEGPARRNRNSKEVQFILRTRGSKTRGVAVMKDFIAPVRNGIDECLEQDYIYVKDMWFNLDPTWWPQFSKPTRLDEIS